MKRVTAIGLAHDLAAAVTVDEVHDAIQRGLPAVLDASIASLATVDADARELEVRPVDSAPRALSDRYQRVSLDSPLPLAEVVRTGQLLVIDDRQAWCEQVSAEVMDDVLAAGVSTAAFLPLRDSTDAVTAVIGVAWDHDVVLDEATLATLQTVGRLCEQTLARAQATDLATQRATDLATLAARLADAMTVEEALEVVTSLGALPVGALATSIGLVDREAGVLRTHHGSGVDDEVRRRFADPSLDERLAFTDAARTGEPVLVEDYDTYQARYPGSAPTTAGLGLGARAAVPIHTSDGDVLGAMVHAWAGPRCFDEALCSTIATIAEMAGQAVERARLLERVRGDAARSEALAALAELLSAARTSDDVAGVIAQHAASVVGADSANVAVLLPATETLQVRHSPSVAAAIDERVTVVARDSPTPHAEVIRDGGTIVLETPEALDQRYPDLPPELAHGSQTWALVPLADSTGQRVGALGLGWSTCTRIDAGTRVAIADAAHLCAQALERAQLSDAEHRLVAALRDAVVTPLPSMDGVYAAGRYLPAARRIGMGGDWYQGIVLDDHRYALVVGDVAGHGITAIGEMAQLQAIIGALVQLDTAPRDVFRQTTTLLRASSANVTATALLVVVDTQSNTLTYVAAGHPPPVLRTAEGETVILSGGRQPMLGVPTEGEGDVGEHPFPPGAVLVAYTDGLVERRRVPIDRSIDGLAGQLRDLAARDADSVADALVVAALADDDHDDDLAIVVLRREG